MPLWRSIPLNFFSLDNNEKERKKHSSGQGTDVREHMLFSPKSQLKIPFVLFQIFKRERGKKNAFKKKAFEKCDGEKTVTNFIESPTWGAICQVSKIPPFALSKSR